MHTLRASEAWRGDTMKRRRGSGCWLQSWRLQTLQLRVCPVCAFFLSLECRALSPLIHAKDLVVIIRLSVCPHPTPTHSTLRVCACVCVCFERLWFFFCLNAATEWVPSLQSSLDFTVNLFVIRNHFGARTNKALWFGSGCTQKARCIFFNYNTTVAWQLSRLLCRLPNVTWEMTANEQKNWETVIWCYEMWCYVIDVIWCDVMCCYVMWYDVM